jgi:hypothetical protein
MAVDLNFNYASYKTYVYPSENMENKYFTREPIIYGPVVANIFVVTAATFVTYNCLVEKRQSVVLDKAIKLTAVVCSLFPDNVQEQLYEDTKEPKQKSSALHNSSSGIGGGGRWTNTTNNEKCLSNFC